MEFKQFAEGAEDDAGMSAGLLAAGAREMMDADLGDGISATGRTRENFGVDQRAVAPQLHVVKNPAAVKFEGAVDVFEFHAEEEADQTGPAPGVELPEQAVLTIEAEATDDVLLFHQWQERRKFVQVELAVAIGEEDQRFSGGADAGLNGGAVAEIGRMVDSRYSRIRVGDGVDYVGRLVGAAVIHQNDFVIHADVPKHFCGGFIDAADVVLLVVAREKDAERVRAGAGGSRGSVWHR